MGFKAGLGQEEMLAVALIIFFGFVAPNVDTTVGFYYITMPIVYLIVVGSKPLKEIEILVQGQDLGRVAAASVAVLMAWIGLSMMVWQSTTGAVSFGFTPQNIQAFFSQLSIFTNIPVLSNDPLLRFIIYGVAIPIAESMLFLSAVLLLWAKLLKVPIAWHGPTSPKFLMMLFVCLLVGISGSYFHLTARSLQDIPLLIDVLFFGISALGVFASTSRIPVVGGDQKVNMSKMIGFHLLVNSFVLIFAV